VLDDIVEGLAKVILRFATRVFFEIIIEVIFFYTGEIVIFILTFGRRTPRWNYYMDESVSKWVIFTEISTWIGIALWLFIAWCINGVLFS
jgi:hypothetical protein